MKLPRKILSGWASYSNNWDSPLYGIIDERAIFPGSNFIIIRLIAMY
jgi:hypothetical protein